MGGFFVTGLLDAAVALLWPGGRGGGLRSLVLLSAIVGRCGLGRGMGGVCLAGSGEEDVGVPGCARGLVTGALVTGRLVTGGLVTRGLFTG